MNTLIVKDDLRLSRIEQIRAGYEAQGAVPTPTEERVLRVTLGPLGG